MAQASASIISNVSEGTGLANYTAHCGSNGWGDPSFNTGDVASLQNYDEYGLVISNCCLPNKFDEPVCFGEALLRADNKGALGHIGASHHNFEVKIIGGLLETHQIFLQILHILELALEHMTVGCMRMVSIKMIGLLLRLKFCMQEILRLQKPVGLSNIIGKYII